MDERGHYWLPLARKCRGCLVILLAALLGHCASNSCRAGGGPENVLVVVNSASWASQAIANEFVRIRQVPPNNVFYVNWDANSVATSVDTFREKILGPVVLNLDRRGLTEQIDYIVFSSDLPAEINLRDDLHGRVMIDQLSPHASITGATFFWQAVIARSPLAILYNRNNEYMRQAAGRQTVPATHGFRSWYGWGPDGRLLEAGGARYYLSTMLGVTSGRGNSVAEVLAYLNRGATADGTHPKGTIYYMQNQSDERRSSPRSGAFEAAAAELHALGIKAEVLNGVLPVHKPDVQGVMIGAENFSWKTCGSAIQPGAICEHLTSFGGMLGEGAGQAPLTEFLRYGAAGSSGTVVEPYAIQDKFPVPAIHVHYARGCSLAEAYFQSVYGPYQLLIVGDPLCQPWANVPVVDVKELKPGDTISGVLELRPKATFAKTSKSEVDRCELFVDGRRTASAAADDGLSLETTALADGYHELRVVAIEAGAIESQGRLVLPVVVDNHGWSMTFTTTPAKTIQWDHVLKLRAEAPGMDGVMFFHNGRLIGRISGESGEVAINPRVLGLGPVTIHAIGQGLKDASQQVWARPVHLTVEPEALLPALPHAVGKRLTRGLLLKPAKGKQVPIQETLDPRWLAAAGVKTGDAFELDGYFDVAANEVYQFQVENHGDLILQVDQTKAYEGKAGGGQRVFVPIHLATGLHRLQIKGRAGAQVLLPITFGGPGTTSLNGAQFRHQD